MCYALSFAAHVFYATNLQPLYDLCKFSAKNIATIFHKQKRLRKPQPIHMSKLDLKNYSSRPYHWNQPLTWSLAMAPGVDLICSTCWTRTRALTWHGRQMWSTNWTTLWFHYGAASSSNNQIPWYCDPQLLSAGLLFVHHRFAKLFRPGYLIRRLLG